VQRPLRVAQVPVDAVEGAQGQVLLVAGHARQALEALAGQLHQPLEVHRQ
jgi:hypothetical protein